MSELNTCNCCEGLSPQTPMPISNRPGLHAIAYRAGAYHEFRESMLSRLSASGLPALHSLTSRANDDFSIALLDAWAVVSDVLTFYQERIANETYLRTATERFSVLQMARLIGYELRPGVAAGTYLAFTLDETTAIPMPVPGMAKSADPMTPALTLTPGVKVQSVPGPGEKAQTFETIESIRARPEWNAIRPRLMRPQQIRLLNGFFIFDEINNDLKKGDVLLVRGDGAPVIKKILKTEIDTESKTTKVYTENNISVPPFTDDAPLPDAAIADIAGESKLTNAVLTAIVSKTWKEDDLAVLVETKKWPLSDVVKGVRKRLENLKETTGSGVYVFRKTALPFGYNAVRKVTYNANHIPRPASKWKEWKLDEHGKIIYLDSEYKEVVPGSFIGVLEPGQEVEDARVFRVEKANTGSSSKYGMNSKSTRLDLFSADYTSWYDPSSTKLSAIRNIAVFVQSEQLEMAELPVDELIQGDVITLDHWYPGLRKGQKIILTGEPHDLKGTIASEVMELEEVLVKQGYTVVRFTQALVHVYIRKTVAINANVALATHGETVTEVLGSGNTSIAFQRFTLRQPPLTHISASSAAGTETTLKVYVNDILWHEAETFFGHLPEERIYVTRLDNDGKTTITFGDGTTGSRLPTGRENIKAIYRKGIGLGGLVNANQLSQLLTRPLGVKAAVNPIASAGAADPERLDEARSNAPLALLTLGRIVSLQDYEDFARAFAGIEKSLATWTWRKQRRCIFVTVAGTNGAAVSKNAPLYKNLLKAMSQSGDPRVHVEVESYRPLFFRLSANIKMHPDYLPEKVLPVVEQQLRSAFSFRERSFGQPVTLSEVITVCQQVEGVVAVDIDKLYYADGTEDLLPILKSGVPSTGDETVLAAELLTLDPGPTDLKIVS